MAEWGGGWAEELGTGAGKDKRGGGGGKEGKGERKGRAQGLVCPLPKVCTETQRRGGGQEHFWKQLWGPLPTSPYRPVDANSSFHRAATPPPWPGPPETHGKQVHLASRVPQGDFGAGKRGCSQNQIQFPDKNQMLV